MKLTPNDPMSMRPDMAIYLNDIRQEMVIEADEEAGYIIRYTRYPKLPFRVERVEGKVRIVFWCDQLNKVRPI